MKIVDKHVVLEWKRVYESRKILLLFILLSIVYVHFSTCEIL
jgi:hypothetical protein